MADVLIATLGESPVVVSTTWKKLRDEGCAPDLAYVQVLYPERDPFNRFIAEGYFLLEKHLSAQGCTVEPVELPFPDATTYEHSITFLRMLAKLLTAHEEAGNRVFLSLAGGRKHLSALMGILTPFYSTIAGYYHMHDSKRRRVRWSIEDLRNDSDETQHAALFPNLQSFRLIELWKPGKAAQCSLREWLANPDMAPSLQITPEAESFYTQIFYPRLDQPPSVYSPPHNDQNAPLVLLAPLGDTAMIVPQTIALLQDRGRNVEAVWLIYPEYYMTAKNNARTITEVCQRRQIAVHKLTIDSDDLDETSAAEQFVAQCHAAIAASHERYSDAQLAVLLAGGRKGMAVLAFAVAHARQVHAVYHTTIKDPLYEQQLEQHYVSISNEPYSKQATFLFLEAPETSDHEKFSLIPVPLLPLQRAT